MPENIDEDKLQLAEIEPIRPTEESLQDYVNNKAEKVLENSLEKGDEVKLSGFGNFSLLKKKARPGRNPRTGEEYVISARTSISFKPGRKLRDKSV